MLAAESRLILENMQGTTVFQKIIYLQTQQHLLALLASEPKTGRIILPVVSNDSSRNFIHVAELVGEADIPCTSVRHRRKNC